MSIHDETWDKCQHCGQTIKTWHGNRHDNADCCKDQSPPPVITMRELQKDMQTWL